MTGVGTVAVAGLGLIGGSLARDLAAAGVRVLGGDADPDAVRAALDEGVIAAALGPGLAGVEEAEVLVLAVPVSAAEETLRAAGSRLDGLRLVTDVGSTKRGIAAVAERLGLGGRFVGVHPRAGDHRSGWSASRPGLFAGARVFVCPSEMATDGALSLARALWEGVGGRVETLSPEEHDRRLAWSSHLPQAVATSLARALAAAGIPRAELGPGGRDTTRLAGSSPEMWTAIARDNADFLAAALEGAEATLRELREAVAAGDEAALSRIFREGRGWADEG